MDEQPQPKTTVNPPFTQLYSEIIRLCSEAITAAAADDVEKLHAINHKLIGHSINVSQFSYLGVTVKKIQQQQTADPTDHHPV